MNSNRPSAIQMRGEFFYCAHKKNNNNKIRKIIINREIREKNEKEWSKGTDVRRHLLTRDAGDDDDEDEGDVMVVMWMLMAWWPIAITRLVCFWTSRLMMLSLFARCWTRFPSQDAILPGLVYHVKAIQMEGGGRNRPSLTSQLQKRG